MDADDRIRRDNEGGGSITPVLLKIKSRDAIQRLQYQVEMEQSHISFGYSWTQWMQDKKTLLSTGNFLTSCLLTTNFFLLRLICNSIIFENLLSLPDAEYEIAFRLFDTDGTGKITKDQFKQILSANIGKDAIPFDFECEWLKLYTGGKDATHEMAYKEFTQLLKGLQSERLRQEFRYYDKEATGYIAPDAFQKVITDIAGHKLSEQVLDNLPTLCNLYPGNKISFANVMAFYNVIREMDMVERVVRKALESSKGGAITKGDFLNMASRETRFSLFTPMEADIIFHFAGLDNPSGKLTLKDFFGLLESKWEHALPVTHPEAPVIKHGALHDLLKGSCKSPSFPLSPSPPLLGTS
jgi:solute carrier family 25 aspartate/glutamate transporter 12/13